MELVRADATTWSGPAADVVIAIADQVWAVVDQHRDGWLHGYRGVLGFAFPPLVRTATGT